MEQVPLTVTKATNGDYFASLPYRPVRLPEGYEVDHLNPHVLVTNVDLIEVIEFHKEHNQKAVNAILSKYL